jgi:hypothetical protein
MTAEIELSPPAATQGRRYCLTPQLDLAVFYDAETARFVKNGNRYLLELMPKEKFISTYKHCVSLGFACAGHPIGGVIFDGTQAHIAVLLEHHGYWTFLLKPACDWLFKLKPEIKVQLESNNLVAIRFMERNGWKRLDDACLQVPGEVSYMLTQQKTRRWLRCR